jgi:hypothetical protein
VIVLCAGPAGATAARLPASAGISDAPSGSRSLPSQQT